MAETKNNIYTALIEAQKAMGPVKKEAKGNYGTYATLDTVIDVIDTPLHDNGLVYTQLVDVRDEKPVLLTRLIHAESGESIESVYPIVSKDPQDPQKLGGSLTYSRRYSLLALLGLAPEDDDAQAASTPAARPQQSGATTGQIVQKTPAPQAASAAHTCPDCGGPMWDNRAKKASGEFASNRPDFSCKKQGGNPDCRGAIWPPKDQESRPREDDGFGSRPVQDEVSDDDLAWLREQES